MPRPSQKKTKPTRGTPYARTTNVLEPHTFPRPALVAEFESLVDKYSARKRRGRPRKEEPTLACSWCSKVAVQIEGQTNIFQKLVTLRKLHAGHHTPDQLMEEAEQRLSFTEDSLDLTTFNTEQLSALVRFNTWKTGESGSSLFSRLSQQELHEVSTTEIQLVLTTFNRFPFQVHR